MLYFLLLVCAFSQETAPPNLDAQFQKLDKKIDQVSQQVAENFESQTQEQKDLQENFKSEISSLGQSVNSMTSKVDSLSSSLEDYKADVSSSLKGLETKNRKSMENQGSVKNVVNDMKASMQSMKADSESLAQRMNDFEQTSQSSHSTHSSNTEELQGSVTATTAKIDALSSSMKKQENAFAKLVEDMEKEKRSSEKVQKENMKMISDLLEQNKVLTDQVEALKGANREQIQNLKAELTRELSSGFLNALDAYTSQMMNLWNLIIDSYTFVIYDITAKLGINRSSVDSVFESLNNGWSGVVTAFTSGQDWLLTNFPVWQQKSWEHMEFAREKAGENMEYARQKAAEHGGKAFETASEYAGVASDHALELKNKISEIKVEEELKKVKANPQVDAFIKFFVTNIQKVFPDMAEEQIKLYVEYFILTSVIIVFFLFSLFVLRMFLKCLGRMCCRGKSMKATVNPPVDLPKKRMPEDYKQSSKATPKKKKGKKGKRGRN